MTWRRKTIVLIVLLISCFCTLPAANQTLFTNAVKGSAVEQNSSTYGSVQSDDKNSTVLWQVNLTDCVNGTYGDQCDMICGHCEQEFCNRSTGFCTGCSAGWFSDSCNVTCPQFCKNSTCEQSTGHCNESGSIKCNAKCQGGCEQLSGKCTNCQEGHYGNFCNKTCDEICINKTCHQNGTCIYGCIDKSFYGNECNLKCLNFTTCSECVDGINCAKKCAETCENCLGDGSCQNCTDGYTGLNCSCNYCVEEGNISNWCNNSVCSKDCQSGLWGDKCQYNCSKTGFCVKCDQKNGTCIQCSNGTYGIDDCNLQCGNCKADSFGNISCDKVSGNCTGECRIGSYGNFCNQSCPQNCLNDYDCSQVTGECEHCKVGYYGKHCQSRCPKNCEPFVCNKSDGKCISCQAGYYGELCARRCSTNCDNGSCDISGHCAVGCIEGWYNDTCEHACSTRCRNNQCHRVTAECVLGCMDGYDGTYCQNVKAGSAGIVLGVVIAFLVIIGIAVAGVCFIRRKSIMKSTRRHSNSTNGIKMKNFSRHSSERNPLINGVNKLPVPARSFKSNAVTDEDLPDEDICYVTSTDPSDYYNLSSRIPVGGFSEYIQKQRAENPEWFKEHFAKLPKGLLKSCDASTSIANRGKCRYKQLYPYDINRVKLEPDGDAKSDFINASYISGYKHTDAFIAAQGPTENTLDDFWRMIWQKNCGKVVMLTNMFEEGKMKCTRYWPDSDAPQIYGQIKVTLVTEDELPDYTVRHFQATHVDTMTVKDIKHFHFTAWPDRGVPEHPSCMLNFRERVMSEPTDLNGPILVHCSAGIGRTGTFVALDYLLRQSHEESHIDVFRVITDMRYQRTNFVQTDIQYEFLHNAIAEALTTKGMEVSVNDFCNHYWSLLECLPGSTTKTKLEDQFEILQQMSPVLDSRCFSAGLNEQNIHKNRYAEILPVDLFRVYLSTPVKGSNEYINAVFLPTCINKTAFVLTQMPLPHTVTDFWRLVYDQRVTTIVMMNNIDDDDETVGEYWPSEDSTYGPFRVELLSCNQFDDYSLITIQLTYTSFSRESKMTVRLYRFETWLDHETIPTSTSALISFILEVSRSPKETVNEPTIVHCMNGVERSGLYCVLAAILQRLRTEQKLNIPQTILQLRNRRPQLIETLKQYDFCHKAIAEYLESNQIYSNVF